MNGHPGTTHRPELDNREHKILLIVRHLGGRASHGKIWDGLERKGMSRLTMERALDDLVKQGLLRRDPPGGGRGWRGEYAYVPPKERKASALFYEDIKAIRGVIAEDLLPEDAPIDRQAEELADLFLCLFCMRGGLFATFLQAALEAKTDKGTIDRFRGHAGYLDESADDTILLTVLRRRRAAPRALEIFRSRLESELQEFGQSRAGHDGESTAGGRPRARAQPHTREGAEGARSRRTKKRSSLEGSPGTRMTSERAAAGPKKVRRRR